MKQGQRVVVLIFGGGQVVRPVWSVGKNLVYLTDDEGFESLTCNQDAIEPIGFPIEDVFEEHALLCTTD